MNFLFFLFFKLIDSSSGQRYPDIDTSDTIKLASFTHKFLPTHTVQVAYLALPSTYNRSVRPTSPL